MCFKPINLSTGFTVPCNRCPKCRIRRVSQWSFRLMQEDKVASSSHFVTLTYDNQNVPTTLFGHLTLELRDLQLFFKRLRRRHDAIKNQKPLKYYAVGEYGGHTERPHYHIILFNAKPELIIEEWKLGNVHFGKVEKASVGYTLKYIMKNRRWFEEYDGRKKEFSVISKGLGISYLNEAMLEWHVSDDLVNRMYCTAPGGVKISMPRYYKDRIYFDMEKAAIAASFEQKMYEKQLKEFEKMTIKTVWNRQQAIDAAYDRMYSSTIKIKI